MALSSAGAGTLNQGVIVHCRDRGAGVALCHQIAGAAFTVAALGGNTQFQLDFIKTHACPGEAGNLAVRDAVADADDHGETGLIAGVSIINTNWSHY